MAPGELWSGLLAGSWFGALVELLVDDGLGLTPSERDRAVRLATVGRRVLDLDAEDFATMADELSPRLGDDLRRCAFPPGPRSPDRGALGSLRPLYALMLEALDRRARRAEPLQMVVIGHLIGEYLVPLAWEPVLGHAADPLRMRTSVKPPGELTRFGTDDARCPHSAALRGVARRSLHACEGDESEYRAYLDRYHSRVGDALALCAQSLPGAVGRRRPDVGESCDHPCPFVTQRTSTERSEVDARVRLARIYQESPLVALRHHAPAGHFFGVPSVEEIRDAWQASWKRLSAPWPDGGNPLAGAPTDAEESLPGLSALVSAVAATPVRAGRIIGRIGDELGVMLGVDPAGPAARRSPRSTLTSVADVEHETLGR